MRLIWILLIFLGQSTLLSSQEIRLENFAAGFQLPVDIAHAGDDRLFIVEKGGVIKILNPDGTVNQTPFLDIDPIVNSQANERGLLGLAFHPEYASNGYFFVYYTNASGATVVSRFSVSNDPNVADATTEKLVFTTPQPFSNHNGGCIKFSPADGYLYIGIGDGGSGGDPQDNGQDGVSYLGKMLRLDINTAGPYAIPPDNPFIDEPAINNEIWSYGLRNPWRFSFDKETADMWIGDVGQNEWEEIDFEAAGDGGHNYGWRCYEGFEQYNFSGCDSAGDYTFPVFVYANSSFNEGCSVTGGFVYRGTAYPSLQGSYIFADYCSGQFWLSRQSACGIVTTENLKGDRNEYSSFGEDVNGELYITAIGEGRIYKIGTTCDLNITATLTAPTCLGSGDGAIDIDISGSSSISSIEWSNGFDTEDLTNIDSGDYTVTVRDDNGCVMERCFTLDAPDAEESCDLGEPIAREICAGETITLTPQCLLQVGSIRWFKDGELIQGEENTSLQISEGGLYSIQVYTADCEYAITDLYSISESPAEAAPDFVQDGNTLVAETGYFQYIWFLNGVEVQSGSSNVLAISEDGNYAVQARNDEGCLTLISSEETITLSSTIDDLGISSLDIFPNPTSDKCIVKMKFFQPEDVQMQLLDVKGATVIANNYSASTELQETIDLNTMPTGLYMLRIMVGGKQLNKKVLKQ